MFDLAQLERAHEVVGRAMPPTPAYAAIRAYWTDTHNLAEGAGAAALAAALKEKAKLRGRRVGLILSGGNIDFDLFTRWIAPDTVADKHAITAQHELRQ